MIIDKTTKKIALLFNRTYIDAHQCFMELANQLAKNGFEVDLYTLNNSFNFQPFFENYNIRILPFPVTKFQKAEYWYKILFSKDRKYNAIIATPINGTWLALRTAAIQKIPYYYFADELVDHLLKNILESDRNKMAKRNYLANKRAVATIALGKERFILQRELNKIDYPHEQIIIPNAPAGNPVKLKSNYFRDIFQIEDRKPILLFAGTLNWQLAKKIYEETKTYNDRDYHIVYHARTLGSMGEDQHPFIKMSRMPIPSTMLNYMVSSADIGLALYDRESISEKRNAFTGGKIGIYLKNGLPLIAGNAEELKVFETEKVGIFWDGESSINEIATKAIKNMENYRRNIPAFYREHLQYEFFFENLKSHLNKSIK